MVVTGQGFSLADRKLPGSRRSVFERFCQVVATTTDRLGLEERLLFVRHTSPVTNAETP